MELSTDSRASVSCIGFAVGTGAAIAPATFGAFADDLLVGNFSFAESEINAFDPASGLFIGTIPITVGLGNALVDSGR
jgi:predicted histidine transporter YuiF (NhaC family)